MQLFTIACELKSIARAAERLGMAASAASRRIQILEHDAGTALLTRKPHGVQPTAAGQTFLRFARDILHLVDRADHLLTEHESGMRGYVRVASSSSVLLARLAADLSKFAELHPDIEIDLQEQGSEGTLEMVRNKEADIGLFVGAFEAHSLVTFPFGGDRLILAVPQTNPLALHDRMRFEAFIDQDFVTMGHNTAVRKVLAEQARLLGRTPRIRVQVNSFEVMALMASQGLGIGILPEAAVRPVVDAYKLKIIEIDEPWASRNFLLCIRSVPELEPPTRRLMTFLLNQ
ncbi:DNA-binding transcriptional LysR family regulator [Nitrobacteraceae bacterium AZCC 2161]